jgi:two-component system, chemotaxis family, response regulator PixH
LARKILLADDSVTAQNMGRKILTDAGYEVVTVNNGSAALKKIFEVKPDVIVLDVYMPGYSGLEVCQRIKENKDSSRIPILLTVGKLEPFKPEEARRVRADAFVVKPFEASELLAALARLEDKIVPQPEPYKPGRFARAVAAVDDQVAVDKDETWKNRLRIPTHESHPEPEPEMPVPSKVLRDLHSEDSGKHEAKREGIFERPMPAGVPADITPEEIAAIAAAAAQLKATATHAQVVEPKERIAEPAEPTPVSTATAPAISAPTDEEGSPVTFASAPEAPAAPAGLDPAETAEPKNATEFESEPVTAAIAPHNVDIAPVAEPPAVEPETQQVAAPDIPVPVAETPDSAVTTSEIAQVEAASVSPSPDTSIDAPPVVAPTPAPQPADDEVMAALQSLMPVTTSPDPLPVAPAQTPTSDVTSSAMAAIAAQVDAASLTAHAPGPRWIAEEVALSNEEATLSLEREMEVAYAAVAASGTVLATSAAVAESPAEPTTIASPEYSAVASPAETTSPALYAMAASATESGSVIAPVTEHASSANITSTHAEEITASAAPASAPSETGEAVPVAAVDDSNLPDSQTSGGVEDMAVSWKNIRDSIATGSGAKAAPAKDKEEISPAETATSESSAPAPEPRASDPKAIASIVDSVLAELRPKIIEEIAKKLADSKKD